MLRVGLTGGIACGKSAVAEAFARRGVPLIDTDLIAREVVEPGEPGLARVAEAFGPDILNADGSLNRAELRARVFADPERKRRLEAILHPLIRARTLERLRNAEGPYAVVVVPLLVETDFDELVDRVLVVDCAPETQVERLVARDTGSRAEAARIIASQAPREARLARANDVLRNDGSLAELDRAVGELHERYLADAARGADLPSDDA